MENTTQALIQPPKAETKRARASLITINEGTSAERQISSDGQFHPYLATKYIADKASNRYVSVGELAKVFYGANTPTAKKRIRKRVGQLFVEFLAKGQLLIVERDGAARTSRTTSLKLYNPKSEEDTTRALQTLASLNTTKEVSAERLSLALNIISEYAAAVVPEDSEADSD